MKKVIVSCTVTIYDTYTPIDAVKKVLKNESRDLIYLVGDYQTGKIIAVDFMQEAPPLK